MRNIKTFNSKSDYVEFSKSAAYLRPNVSFCKDVNNVVFNTPDATKPEQGENTPEQAELAELIIQEILAATKTVRIDFTSAGTLNNIELPEETPVFVYLTGPFDDGATVTSKSSKGLSLVCNGNDAIDITIDAPSSISLGGKFNNVWSNVSLSTTNALMSEYFKSVTFSDENNGNITISGDFKDGAKVNSLTEGKLTVTNQNEATSVTIYAPNADVVVNGKYRILTATSADETLYLNPSFHAKKLVVKEGNVKFYGVDIDDFVDAVEGDCDVRAMEWNVPEDATVSKMTSNPGIYNLTASYSGTSVLGFGLFANGKYQYNLNGYAIESTNKNYLLFLRGTAIVDIYGEGRMANIGEGYGCWVSSKGATLNVYGGEFEGNTHTLYAENGTINVYGGTFKLSNADTAERDVNGNLKFLLNCFDTNYTSGDAKINVYGGKFYEFNPAVSYGEPGGPISYVADGYHVVESIEDGKKVFEVVKDE